MQHSEFQHAIAVGLGRVIQHLHSHDAAPYTDLILDACLHNKAYDPQVEGTHAAYLFEIIKLTPQFEYFRDQILAALAAAEPSEDWDYLHLMYLALNLADDGYQPARDALYARLNQDVEAGFTDIAFALLSLDGLPALKLIAEHPEIDWNLTHLAYEISDYPIEDIAAATSSHLSVQQALLAEVDAISNSTPIDRDERREKDRQQYGMSYQEMRQALADQTASTRFDTNRLLQGWGRNATDTDLLLAAQDLLTEQNQERLEQLVTIFAKRPFPLEPTRLIELVRSRRDSESLTALRANTALTQLCHPEVRQLALELLKSDQPDLGMELLEKNFEEGDWHLINTAISQPAFSVRIDHGLGMAVKTLALAYPSPYAAPALLAMYERTPCSACRERIVIALHTLNLLPAHILEECKFDSNSDLRQLIQNNFIEPEND